MTRMDTRWHTEQGESGTELAREDARLHAVEVEPGRRRGARTRKEKDDHFETRSDGGLGQPDWLEVRVRTRGQMTRHGSAGPCTQGRAFGRAATSLHRPGSAEVLVGAERHDVGIGLAEREGDGPASLPLAASCPRLRPANRTKQAVYAMPRGVTAVALQEKEHRNVLAC
jgi:hypothetical protein